MPHSVGGSGGIVSAPLMSSGDEFRSSEQSGNAIGESHIAVRISSMTGHEWIEVISPTETVQSLKVSCAL